LSLADNAVPENELVWRQRNLVAIGGLANQLAELVAPPTVRHQAKPSAAMITSLMPLHHALAQQFTGTSWRKQAAEQKKAMEASLPTIASMANPLTKTKLVSHFRAAQLTIVSGSRPICGKYFEALVVLMTPSCVFGVPGRARGSARRNTRDCSRRGAR
jgi:hypothetical protein